MSDELEPLSPRLRALLDQERAAPTPSADAAQARLLAMLKVASAPVPPSGHGGDGDGGAGPSDGGAPPAPPVPPAAVTTAAGWSAAKALLVAGATGALGFMGGMNVASREPAPPAPPPAVEVAPAPSVAPPRATDAGTEAPANVVPPTPPPRRPRAVPAPEPVVAPPPAREEPSGPLDVRNASERQLIDAARVALGRGRAHDALVFLMGHERRFASGVFVEERELLVTEALVQEGKRPQAEARARAFLARYPNSTHAPRMRTLLGQGK